MKRQVFKNREMVEKQVNLPGEYHYSFVGDSSPEYHAKLNEIVERLAGPQNVRRRTFRKSAKGNYTAYKFDVFHQELAEVEEVYREVGVLEGTRFLL